MSTVGGAADNALSVLLAPPQEASIHTDEDSSIVFISVVMPTSNDCYVGFNGSFQNFSVR